MRASFSSGSAFLALAFVLGAAGTYPACSAGHESDGVGVGASAAGGAGVGGTGGNTNLGGFDTGGSTQTGTGGDCGYAEYPTELEPGLLLLVYDQSCSMVECPDGSSEACVDCAAGSKWDLAQSAMQTVLNGLPDELRMGLLLYPTNEGMGCQAPAAPQVAPDPLSTTRTPILNALAITPNGGGTPTLQGLQAGYQTLQSISDTGNKAVLLVTDGAWNCYNTNEQLFSAAAAALNDFGFRTFVVGILQPLAAMSRLAHDGGTDRIAGCNFEVATLQQPFVDTCEDDTATCCHYIVGQNVEQDLVDALEQVASQLLTSCIFAVPKGPDPSDFDPNLVNVFVDGQIVPPDEQQGWTYVGGGTDFIEIHGDLCDQLLAGEKNEVAIQLGCPTVPPA